MAARRADLEPRAAQPLGDHEANDSSWALRPIALLDDGTALLRVGVPGPADIDGSATQTLSFASGPL